MSSISRIGPQTAKTFEDFKSKFSFRVAGDGKVEEQLLDGFKSSAPVVESIDQRALKAFVAAEHALTQKETAPANEDAGKEALGKLAEKHLGEGWSVDSYYDFSARMPGPERTVVQYSGSGGTQKIDIEHRGNERAVTVGTTAFQDGWKIDHSIQAPLDHKGQMDTENFVEQAYFSH